MVDTTGTDARFIFSIGKLPERSKKILDVLAQYDLYQFDNNIKPDYCNAGGLQVEDINGDWYEWDNEEGETIDEIEFDD